MAVYAGEKLDRNQRRGLWRRGVPRLRGAVCGEAHPVTRTVAQRSAGFGGRRAQSGHLKGTDTSVLPQKPRPRGLPFCLSSLLVSPPLPRRAW